MTSTGVAQGDLFRLDGRVAFLSGAPGLLGRPIAHALAAAGAHVILNSRNEDKLRVLATTLATQGLKASVACFDVTDDAAMTVAIERIADEFGRLDVLVNNAASGRPGTIETATLADFDAAYRVNVTASFRLVQVALPLLTNAGAMTPGGASVINVSSMYGSVSPDPSIYGTSGANNPPYYGAAKAALLQLTRYEACHLAPRRIRCNSVSPGPFPARGYLTNDPKFEALLQSKTPMRRTGDPDELRGPVLFLASDASSYVTGTNLPVDGGWTAW